MSYEPLRSRFDSIGDIPIVLAGPILRRVKPESVTVWIALKSNCYVTLKVFRRGNYQAEIQRGSRQTVSLGSHLHVVAVTASGQSLDQNQIYEYNLEFSVQGGPDNIGLFENGVLGHSDNQRKLCYPGFNHPSFVLPPRDINYVRIVHASCRKPHAEGYDALAILDNIISEHKDDPNQRPQQLFLTGDQIYADDVADYLLDAIIDIGSILTGSWDQPWYEALPTDTGLVISPSALASGQRSRVANSTRIADFTSEEARSHLFRLGEFFAMYLLVWSETLWPANLPAITSEDIRATQLSKIRNFRNTLPLVRRSLANIATYMMFDDHEITDDWNLNLRWCEKVYRHRFSRRVIINGLSAYAIFQAWGNTPERFESGSTGDTLLTNLSAWCRERGMLPALDVVYNNIAECVGVPGRIADRIRNAINREDYRQASIFHPPSDPNYFPTQITPLEWNYVVDGLRYRVAVLDTRTWRAYATIGDNDPPGLLSDQALVRQIPPFSIDKIITIIISPAPVIGQPFIEAVQEALYHRDAPEGDLEAWKLQRKAFESFIAAITQNTKEFTENGVRKHKGWIIFFSGDVHYAFAARAQYWGRRPFRWNPGTEPLEAEVVFVQLVSSASKNEEFKTGLFHRFGYVPGLMPREPFITLGWNRQNAPSILGRQRLQDVIGHPEADMKIANLRRLRTGDPAVFDFVVNNALVQRTFNANLRVDWSYRVDFFKDETIINNASPLPNPPLDQPRPSIPQIEQMAENVRALWEGTRGSEIVAMNNIGLISFSWDSDDPNASNKSVTQDLLWRVSENNRRTRFTISLGLNLSAQYPNPSILYTQLGGP